MILIKIYLYLFHHFSLTGLTGCGYSSQSHNGCLRLVAILKVPVSRSKVHAVGSGQLKDLKENTIILEGIVEIDIIK